MKKLPVYDEEDFISPKIMAKLFHITLNEIAGLSGIPKSSLQRSDRSKSNKTQLRLKEAVEIISLVTPWAGGELLAYAWYRSEPIPALGGVTAESAVKMGNVQSVKDYIHAISMGGYA